MVGQAGLETITASLEEKGLIVEIPMPILRPSRPGKLIRGLLAWLNVSPSNFGELDRLKILALNKGWDGPEAIANIRNALTHAVSRGESKLAFEASQLAMWYLELTILKLCDFQGDYTNRTVLTGPWFRREKVPWA